MATLSNKPQWAAMIDQNGRDRMVVENVRTADGFMLVFREVANGIPGNASVFLNYTAYDREDIFRSLTKSCELELAKEILKS